jgi:hypothetical protein
MKQFIFLLAFLATSFAVVANNVVPQTGLEQSCLNDLSASTVACEEPVVCTWCSGCKGFIICVTGPCGTEEEKANLANMLWRALCGASSDCCYATSPGGGQN